VFIRYSPGQKLTILSIPGVLHVLGGMGCRTVSAEELDHIRLALADGYPLRPHPGLAIGMRVRVCAGIFQGAEAIVTEMRRECKVVMALAAVQQSFSLEIEVEQLEPVDMPPQQAALTRSVTILH
jgi:transcription antitermination factor NusG